MTDWSSCYGCRIFKFCDSTYPCGHKDDNCTPEELEDYLNTEIKIFDDDESL